jgi:DNA invertase Pin-like site-specific DNA recombinase
VIGGVRMKLHVFCCDLPQSDACFIKAYPAETTEAFLDGPMARPVLKRLLEDIQAGKIQIVVVYKVDRLTRSLADFAKIVDVFDAHNVSFVAVTQQFNTTMSTAE